MGVAVGMAIVSRKKLAALLHFGSMHLSKVVRMSPSYLLLE
jgi:hypothetical protein